MQIVEQTGFFSRGWPTSIGKRQIWLRIDLMTEWLGKYVLYILRLEDMNP